MASVLGFFRCPPMGHQCFQFFSEKIQFNRAVWRTINQNLTCDNWLNNKFACAHFLKSFCHAIPLKIILNLAMQISTNDYSTQLAHSKKKINPRSPLDGGQ